MLQAKEKGDKIAIDFIYYKEKKSLRMKPSKVRKKKLKATTKRSWKRD